MNEERIKLLQSYMAEEPDNPFNAYALAMEYFDHAPEKAAKLLMGLTEQHPEYLPTYYKAATLFWELEDIPNARSLFEKGIALAKMQKNEKALGELNAAYLNFQFEEE